MQRALILQILPWRWLTGLWLAFALLGSIAPAQAQTTPLSFTTLSSAAGLSQSVVNTMLQDHLGLLWFGTQDGLNRYDGYQFTVYRHDQFDPQSLPDSYILTLYEDRQGQLWIGTADGGLSVFERTTGTFRRYQHDPAQPTSLINNQVLAICEDRWGDLWIGTRGGLDRLDRTTGQFTHFQHDPEQPTSLSDNGVAALLEDTRGNLWIGTRAGGLNRFDRATERFLHYSHLPGQINSLSHERVTSLLEDRKGQLWIGTRGGLNRFDPATNRFERFEHAPSVPTSLGNNEIMALAEDAQGTLWIGTNGSGLDAFAPPEPSFRHARHNPDVPTSLSHDVVRAVLVDRGGLVWVGTAGGGLSKLTTTRAAFVSYAHNPQQQTSLSSNQVQAIAVATDGSVWVGTNGGGLNRLIDSQATRYRTRSGDSTSLSADSVLALHLDRSQTLWVGTTRGLDRFDPATDQFTQFQFAADDPASLGGKLVGAIYEDPAGTLWLGTRDAGLQRFDQTRGSFVRYEHDPADPHSLSDNRVLAVTGDPRGGLWIGTRGGGLNHFAPTSGQFTRYLHVAGDSNSVSDNRITALLAEPDGTLWIGTHGGGLDRFEPNTGHWSHFTARDGLASNTISSMERDREGRLWLGTTQGLTVFDPAQQSFRTYTVDDGLQSNEFGLGAAAQGAQGELWFGGPVGLQRFDPAGLHHSFAVPPVVITSFKKFNQTVQTDLAPDTRLTLSYRDTFFAFEFAALDYSAPGKNEYAYRLDGFDSEWIDAGTRRFASYTNLDGGDYVFRVKAKNSDGVWNMTGVAIFIHITQPFWQTWWFYTLLGLGAVGVLIGGYWLRMRSLQAHQQHLTTEVAARTSELASVLTISHTVASTLQVEPLFRLILDELQVLVPYQSAMILALEGAELRVLQYRGSLPAAQLLSQRIALADAAHCQAVIQGRRPVLVSDWQSTDSLVRAVQPPQSPLLQTVIGTARSWLGVPLIAKEQLIGLLCLDAVAPAAYSSRQAALVLALANQAAITMDNVRLYEQAQDSAALQERQKLARELHDSVSQALYGIALGARTARTLLDRNPQQAAEPLDYVLALAEAGLSEMRALIFELRPESLANEGLVVALTKQAAALRARHNLEVTTELAAEPSLPLEIKTALYRIAQEALHNIVKHARATSVSLGLGCTAQAVRLTVCDNGIGFDAAGVFPGHLGLISMRERVARFGGSVTISSGSGLGTTVCAEIPYELALCDESSTLGLCETLINTGSDDQTARLSEPRAAAS